VYQFSLPPLLAHGLLSGNAAHLNHWARSLPEGDGRRTFFNFTASHDGVGVRPLQGLIPDDQLTGLIQHVERMGGQVSTRSLPDGSQRPYELNITYFDLFGDDPHAVSERQVTRFLSSQAIMLAMRGIPAIYFNSLFGARNHWAGVEASGQARRINRQKWQRRELEGLLEGDGTEARVFDAYLRLLELRKSQPAFHPDGRQAVLALGDRFFGLERQSPDGAEIVLSITNFSDEPVKLPPLHHGGGWHDLITHQRWPLQGKTAKSLMPWQTVWLKKLA
jgi:sucrose phosphorylase